MNKRQALFFVFRDRFPTLEDDFLALEPGQSVRVLPADDSAMWLELTEIQGRVRVAMHGSRGHTSAAFSDRAVQDAMLRELKFLRNIAEFTPQQIWQQDSAGNLIWANHAYLATSDQFMGTDNNNLRSRISSDFYCA